MTRWLRLFSVCFVVIGLQACNQETKPVHIALATSPTTKKEPIHCTEEGCSGTYTGPEFIQGSDVAHQFSNTMAAAVGKKLKALYAQGTFVQVDAEQITMSTKGMGSGTVVYTLQIPFLKVTDSCDAYTSFDHVGGWNHQPALARRKRELSKLLLPGDSLAVSSLKTTPEGLQEYWIQWRNQTVQAACR